MKEDCLECKITRRTFFTGLVAYSLYNSTLIPKFSSLTRITTSHKYLYLAVGQLIN